MYKNKKNKTFVMSQHCVNILVWPKNDQIYKTITIISRLNKYFVQI